MRKGTAAGGGDTCGRSPRGAHSPGAVTLLFPPHPSILAPGEAQSFLDHIQLGIEETALDPDALLLFSGGQTRRAAGPRSEGLSYWVVAEAANWFGHPEVGKEGACGVWDRDGVQQIGCPMNTVSIVKTARTAKAKAQVDA